MVGEGPFNLCADASKPEDAAQGVVSHGPTDKPCSVSWLRVVVDIKEKGRVRLHHGLGAQGHIEVIEGHWAALIICCPCLWGKGPVALAPPGLRDSFIHLEEPVAKVVLVLRDVTDFELQAFMG